MLIQFSVANFRSIREQQTLQLVAGEDDELPENVIAPQTRGGTPLLRSCGIFGANASGKSNLILAMHTMREIVTSSASWQLGATLPVTPFLLHSATAAQPSEFEICFIAEDIRYQYGFAATPSAITKEWLYAYPNGERQIWFERELQDDAYKWTWGDHLPDDKQTWQRATRDNALFLSTATLLNSSHLRLVYDWFAKTLQTVGIGTSALPCQDQTPAAAKMLQTALKPAVMEMLESADLGIDDLAAVESSRHPRHPIAQTRERANDRYGNGNGATLALISFHYNEKGEKIAFDWKDESGGTRRLFSLVAPWLDAIQNGRVLIVDEPDRHMHPNLAHALVYMFHDLDINHNNPQLVFAAQDSTLVSTDTMRPDQIWFCDKDDNETALHSLSAYPLSREEHFNRENMYLGGQFGAVPCLTDFNGERLGGL